MKTMMKRIISLVLALSMLGGIAPAALALDADGGSPEAVVSDSSDPGAANEGGVQTPDDVQAQEGASEAEEAPPDPDGALAEVPEEAPEAIPEDEPEPVALEAAPVGMTLYVASSAKGGSAANPGTEAAPLLRISDAIGMAADEGAAALTIILKSNIEISQELVFDGGDADFPITVTSASGQYRIQYAGTNPIGGKSGVFRVTNGAEVTFENVKLAGSTGTYDGRVLYVAENAVVNLVDAVISDGRVTSNIQMNEGGAGAFVADKGTLNVSGDTVFENNQTVAGGGAIYVADGGTVNLGDSASICGNEAALGGGVFADAQTHSYGGLSLGDSAAVADNRATENGSGLYLGAGANASARGNVQIAANYKGSAKNNVYLCEGATLDISGTTTGAAIGLTCENEAAYRLVSLPDGYKIKPTTSGDEMGWSDDCGAWDVRHMTYHGVEGLYLYHKTLDMTFEDVNTLASVSGKDINSETADFLNDGLPSCTKENGVLTVADTAARDGENLVITFSVDKDEYRIPTKEVVNVTSGGADVAFDYAPDFENGTATITIAGSVVEALTDTIHFSISGEKYYTLTIRMEGPLYAMRTSLTGLGESELTISEQESYGGSTMTYKVTSVDSHTPVPGVQVSLYKENRRLRLRQDQVSH